MKTGRRGFLKGVGGATAAALAMTEERAVAAAAPRPVIGARQILELDGVIVGAPRSAEGGGASAVLVQYLDPGFVQRKDVAGIDYEALRLEAGIGMSAAFFDWVRSFFDRELLRKDGALIIADFNYQEAARREFAEALITEVGFPTLDTGSKDPAYMTVGLQPESTHFRLGKGGKVQPPAGKPKSWLQSNFRFTLDGMESATTRVSKVDGFTVKMKVSEDGVGDTRSFDSSFYLEIPNIVLTVPMIGVQAFLDWFDDFVVKGNNGPEAEKSGAIEWLSPNTKDVLGRVDLLQVGIVSIGETKVESNADSTTRFLVELYVEEMRLKMGPVA
jgi:hypothetical protein